MTEMFEKYKIGGDFIDRVIGGLPANPELVETFLTVKGVDAQTLNSAQKMMETAQSLSSFEGADRNSSNIFPKDEKGLFLNAYQIRANLKDAMTIQKSITSWRQKFQLGIRAMPNRIYLMRNGEHLTKADGVMQSVVHTEYMGKPMASLNKSEYIDRPSFECEIWVGKERGKPVLNEDKMYELLQHAGVIGLGAKRTMGYGQWTPKLL